MFKILFCIFILSLFINYSYQDKDSNIQDNQTMLYGCYRLLRIRLKEDKDFLYDYISSYSKLPNVGKTAITSKTTEELNELIKSNIVATCYTEISLMKAAELKNNLDNRINPFTKDNKYLLSLEAFQKNFENNGKNNKFSSLLSKIDNLTSSLADKIEAKSEISNSNKIFDSTIKDVLVNNFNKKKKTNKYENKESNDDLYLDSMEYSNLNLNFFGYNLNDPYIKKTLGTILLILIFLGIFVSYKVVSYKEVKISNKQRKKNKNKQD